MYTSQQQLNNQIERIDIPVLLDPGLLRAARQIYRNYYEVHPDMPHQPLGVAINKYNHRGKLIFSAKPILLSEECFVPFSQINSDY
ncbi:MAG TPA: hypothetical protein V6D15_13180 [Oculatellaceae cyanobacterium]